ncbi:hypothetical protein ACFO8O_10350 [Hephaestia sp. GCM10023244]|uniref:hypothetical protein n=1 Tax=unclassified Hephaestia TaxID=2631281 RepID=UPI0020776258|nr:hypothetical protein [Hephaestia sp. MAHUQ-44]MCM8731359.1 hypothetical protein [Hephaestia sp. MAHUQ-44]
MRTALLATGLCLAACQQAPQTANETQVGDVAFTEVAPDEGTLPPHDSANIAASTSAGSLPPADSPYRYVGRWAATQQACDSGAWRFEERRLTTAGEVSCSFDSVVKAPGGYDIAATCQAEGHRAPDKIKLRFAESARAMLVSSGMWDGVGLTYCGPAG